MTPSLPLTGTKAQYHTFGCKLNFAETGTIERRLAELGVQRAATGDTPDIIVVNTCSVTEVADKKCRQAIRSLHRRYPDAGIAVTGCYAQLKSAEVAELPGVVIVAGTDGKARIVSMITDWLANREPSIAVRATDEIDEFTPSCDRGDRTRFFLKVQDGCDYGCTYCTIPKARGRSRSGSIESLVQQARAAADAGGREIVITGVNIGDFGRGTDYKLIDLLRRLDQVDGIERYRISSIEPNLLTDEIIDFVATSRAFMPHFHVPLQSGSDEVLALMRRRYNTKMFRARMDYIRQTIPDAFIGVDLIVGARGETEQLFADSCRYIESLPISRLHVFTYSERPGTKALEIPHVVSQHDKHQRTSQVIEISNRLLQRFASRFEGTVRKALLEHPKAGKPMGGFTDNYLRISVKADPLLDNRIVHVRLDHYDPATETYSATLA